MDHHSWQLKIANNLCLPKLLGIVREYYPPL